MLLLLNAFLVTGRFAVSLLLLLLLKAPGLVLARVSIFLDAVAAATL